MAIDLNADVGESFSSWTMGDDAALAPALTSMNIACGFHAGDPLVMARTVRLAKQHSVAVGAHVSYRDLAGFGRRFVDVDAAELEAEICYQVGALATIAKAEGVTVSYVKPHGALYNTIAKHEGQARAVVAAMQRLRDAGLPLTLLGLPGVLSRRLAAEAGIPTAVEAFCDRAYTAEGTLVPRSQPGSVLHDPELIAARSVRMVTEGTVEAIDGTVVELHPDSLCVHGDTPGAVAMAQAVRAALEAAGVTLAPCARVA